MENLENELLKRLNSEKVKLPKLSEASKAKISQAILANINCGSKVEQSKIKPIPHIVWLSAALILVSFSVWFLKAGVSVETVRVETGNNIVQNVPVASQKEKITIDPEAVRLMVEKLDPDQLGGVACRLLESEGQLKRQVSQEINALSTLSNKILSNFYDDFRPAEKKEASN